MKVDTKIVLKKKKKKALEQDFAQMIAANGQGMLLREHHEHLLSK